MLSRGDNHNSPLLIPGNTRAQREPVEELRLSLGLSLRNRGVRRRFTRSVLITTRELPGKTRRYHVFTHDEEDATLLMSSAISCSRPNSWLTVESARNSHHDRGSVCRSRWTPLSMGV